MKIKCPCCGYFTLSEDEPKYDICPVCYWENDPFQEKNPEETGANKISLIKARENFEVFGACEPELLKYTRAPLDEEVIVTFEEIYGDE